jgi:hypothetical protein
MKRQNRNISESIGAVSMVRQPADKLNEPDFRTPIPNLISTTRNSSVPMHWNNAPFMSGGRYGANPKDGKSRVMTYKDFVKAKKKFLKNKAKKK